MFLRVSKYSYMIYLNVIYKYISTKYNKQSANLYTRIQENNVQARDWAREVRLGREGGVATTVYHDADFLTF